MGVCVLESRCLQRPKASNSLRLKWQAVVNRLRYVPGTKLRYSRRALSILNLSHLSVLLSSLFNLIFLVHGDISSYHSHSPLSLVTSARLSCIGSLQVSNQLLSLQCWDAAEASVHVCKPCLNPPPPPPSLCPAPFPLSSLPWTCLLYWTHLYFIDTDHLSGGALEIFFHSCGLCAFNRIFY